MKTSVITQDQIIIHHGDVIQCQQYGQPFTVPSGEWAIHFNHDTGLGEVEYIDSRKNEVIEQSTFTERYQYLMDIYQAAAAERQRQEEAARAEQEANEQAQTVVNSPDGNTDSGGVDNEPKPAA